MPTLTGGYFGTRGPKMFSKQFMSTIFDGRSFVDITAGTGQFPYYLATEHNMRVGLIERCPYVAMLLRAVFADSAFLKAVTWDPEPTEGWLWNKVVNQGDWQETFSERVCEIVDGFMIDNKHNDLALHCMARALTRIFAFRNRNWSTKTAEGKPCLKVNAKEVLQIARNTYQRMRICANALEYDHYVKLGDSTEEVRNLPPRIVENGTIYADPAWPYNKADGAGSNPYRFAYEQLSSIMLQKTQKLDTVWLKEDDERIYRDVATWIDDAFELGAKRFILCSQDTNYPSEKRLKAWVSDRWKLDRHERADDFSSSANVKYITYWFYLGPRDGR
jgi:hypothetical protein